MPYTNNQIKSFLKEIQNADFESVLTYRGKKHKELAFALNYILIYAKDYTRFVDLFAGSGTASANVIIDKPKHEFVLNDADFAMAKFFSIFAEIKAGIIEKDILMDNVIKEFIPLQAKFKGLKEKDARRKIKGYEKELKDHHSIYLNDAKFLAYILLIHHYIFGSRTKLDKDILNSFSRDKLDTPISVYIENVFDFYSDYITNSFSYDGTLPETLDTLCNKEKCVIYSDPVYDDSVIDYRGGSKNGFDMHGLIDNLCKSKQQFVFSHVGRFRPDGGSFGRLSEEYTEIGDKEVLQGVKEYENVKGAKFPRKDQDKTDGTAVLKYKEQVRYLSKDKDDYYINEPDINEDDKFVKDIFDRNTSIYENVLHEFEKQQSNDTKYTVVAICRDKKKDNNISILDMLINDNIPFEIMITNIEVPDCSIFYDKKQKRKQKEEQVGRYGLKVLSLSEFNKLVRENVYLDTRKAIELFNAI